MAAGPRYQRDNNPADTARASPNGLRSYPTIPNDVVARTPHASAAGTPVVVTTHSPADHSSDVAPKKPPECVGK